jgi:hypothetical protein
VVAKKNPTPQMQPQLSLFSSNFMAQIFSKLERGNFNGRELSALELPILAIAITGLASIVAKIDRAN